MTEFRDIKGLFSNYKSQNVRQTRKGKQEMINDFVAFIDQLRVDKVRFEIACDPQQDPLFLSVINSETEALIRSFTMTDCYIDEVMTAAKGVAFYAY
jgi:hypothetical protein